MRCPDCEKFVSYAGEEEPEQELIELNDGEIQAEVRIHKDCAECGSELKEATLNMQAELSAAFQAAHQGAGHDLQIDETPQWIATERTEGKGRGLKTFYGASAAVTVKCSCGASEEVAVEDDIPASTMDELS